MPSIDENAPVCIKVCRDGPRGWHWIALSNFNPAIHRIYPPAVETAQPEKKRPAGRPRKQTPNHHGVTNVHC